jgi:hypothetical protein
VPDLPLCLGVLKQRVPLCREPIFLLAGMGLWVIYNSFEFVADMSDLT